MKYKKITKYIVFTIFIFSFMSTLFFGIGPNNYKLSNEPENNPSTNIPVDDSFKIEIMTPTPTTFSLVYDVKEGNHDKNPFALRLDYFSWNIKNLATGQVMAGGVEFDIEYNYGEIVSTNLYPNSKYLITIILNFQSVGGDYKTSEIKSDFETLPIIDLYINSVSPDYVIQDGEVRTNLEVDFRFINPKPGTFHDGKLFVQLYKEFSSGKYEKVDQKKWDSSVESSDNFVHTFFNLEKGNYKVRVKYEFQNNFDIENDIISEVNKTIYNNPFRLRVDFRTSNDYTKSRLKLENNFPPEYGVEIDYKYMEVILYEERQEDIIEIDKIILRHGEDSDFDQGLTLKEFKFDRHFHPNEENIENNLERVNFLRVNFYGEDNYLKYSEDISFPFTNYRLVAKPPYKNEDGEIKVELIFKNTFMYNIRNVRFLVKRINDDQTKTEIMSFGYENFDFDIYDREEKEYLFTIPNSHLIIPGNIYELEIQLNTKIFQSQVPTNNIASRFRFSI